MATTERTFGLRAAEEQDIELEVFEEPIDALFPRLPNTVSRRGHRALRIMVRVGADVIPPEAESVLIEAEVFAFGPDRVGNGRHLFRHRLRWGAESISFPLPEEHGSDSEFRVIVERGLRDDHLGEGPYEATVKVTPQGEGLLASANPEEAAAQFDPDPKVTIRFVSM